MLCDTTLFFSAPNLAAKAEKREKEREGEEESQLDVCLLF